MKRSTFETSGAPKAIGWKSLGQGYAKSIDGAIIVRTNWGFWGPCVQWMNTVHETSSIPNLLQISGYLHTLYLKATMWNLVVDLPLLRSALATPVWRYCIHLVLSRVHQINHDIWIFPLGNPSFFFHPKFWDHPNPNFWYHRFFCQGNLKKHNVS